MHATFAWISLVMALHSEQPSPERIKLFLGALPSAEGFTAANREFGETYRDIRDEFSKEPAFQNELELVQTANEADLVLEIVDRGLRDTGARTSTGTVVGSTVIVGNSIPVRQKTVLAQLAVLGTAYKIDLDGRQGIKLVAYRNQAKNLLRQVVDWVHTNRGALERARTSRHMH
jgi:hypothetical protein